MAGGMLRPPPRPYGAPRPAPPPPGAYGAPRPPAPPPGAYGAGLLPYPRPPLPTLRPSPAPPALGGSTINQALISNSGSVPLASLQQAQQAWRYGAAAQAYPPPHASLGPPGPSNGYPPPGRAAGSYQQAAQQAQRSLSHLEQGQQGGGLQPHQLLQALRNLAPLLEAGEDAGGI